MTVVVDKSDLALDTTKTDHVEHDMTTGEIAPRRLGPGAVAQLGHQSVALLELEVGGLTLQIGEQPVPAHVPPHRLGRLTDLCTAR